jgi:hypothetical protein
MGTAVLTEHCPPCRLPRASCPPFPRRPRLALASQSLRQWASQDRCWRLVPTRRRGKNERCKRVERNRGIVCRRAFPPLQAMSRGFGSLLSVPPARAHCPRCKLGCLCADLLPLSSLSALQQVCSAVSFLSSFAFMSLFDLLGTALKVAILARDMSEHTHAQPFVCPVRDGRGGCSSAA